MVSKQGWVSFGFENAYLKFIGPTEIMCEQSKYGWTVEWRRLKMKGNRFAGVKIVEELN